ncbi:MAG: TSUP family transporter [Oscillospiraceae bacterium]|nr:TSUP family transporter [Oscillospiraceae bacterium]
MKKHIDKVLKALIGLLCGGLNGLFGSGGGVVAVPLFKKLGLSTKKCHATSVALIFFLSLLSVISLSVSGNLDYATTMEYLPAGAVGAAVGALWLKKIPNHALRRIFGCIVLASSIRLLLK